MKKTMKLFSLLLIVVLMSGCVKYNINMEVGKDKSVTIEVISAMEETYYNSESVKEEAEVAEKKGFKIEEYSQDNWKGSKFVKKYDNIDKISSDKKVTVELSDIIDESKEDIKVYFQKKSSIFKTTYIANFTVDMSTEDDSNEYDSLASSMDLKYVVKLPTAANKQNTKTISEDGKTLTWNLQYGKVNEINYEFSMVNTMVYVIVGAIAVVLVGGIIFVVMNQKKKKNNMQPMNGPMQAPTTNENNMNNTPQTYNDFGAYNTQNINQPLPQENVTTQPEITFETPSTDFVSNNTPNLDQTLSQESTNTQPEPAPEETNTGFIPNNTVQSAEMPSLENQPPIIQGFEEQSQQVNEINQPVIDNTNNTGNGIQ